MMDPALHRAATNGNVASLRRLVANDLKILDSVTPQGNTALHIAAYLGHTDFAREVLSCDKEMLVRKNEDGETPLHLAARAGRQGVADLLIEIVRSWPENFTVGSCLLTTNKVGNTPLHEAVKHRKGGVAVRLLVADPKSSHVLNWAMESPLHIAAREGLVDVVAKIVECPWVAEEYVPSMSVSGTPLHQAVLGGHISKNFRQVPSYLYIHLGKLQSDSSGDFAT